MLLRNQADDFTNLIYSINHTHNKLLKLATRLCVQYIKYIKSTGIPKRIIANSMRICVDKPTAINTVYIYLSAYMLLLRHTINRCTIYTCLEYIYADCVVCLPPTRR